MEKKLPPLYCRFDTCGTPHQILLIHDLIQLEHFIDISHINVINQKHQCNDRTPSDREPEPFKTFVWSTR